MLVKEISSARLGTGSLKIWTQTSANWNWTENNVGGLCCIVWLQWWQPHCSAVCRAGPSLQPLMSGNDGQLQGNYGLCGGRGADVSGIIANYQRTSAPASLPSIKNLILRLLFCESRLKSRIKETNPSAGPLWRTMHWSEIFRWISQSNLALYSPLWF